MKFQIDITIYLFCSVEKRGKGTTTVAEIVNILLDVKILLEGAKKFSKFDKLSFSIFLS